MRKLFQPFRKIFIRKYLLMHKPKQNKIITYKKQKRLTALQKHLGNSQYRVTNKLTF